MNLLLTGFVGGVIGGGVLGYWLASHVHSVAAAAASAVARATTIPSGVAAQLGDAAAPLQTAASAVGSTAVKATDAVTPKS